VNTPYAIIFSIGLAIVCALVSELIQWNLAPVMILITSLWAAIDSSRIELTKYKTGISNSPVVLFIACALLWIIGFPWYLSVRHKIKTGAAVLKDASPSAAA
jgi:hypothetical protein